MAFQGGACPHLPPAAAVRQRPRYRLNFGRNLRNGTIGGVARAATQSRCNSPSPRSSPAADKFRELLQNDGMSPAASKAASTAGEQKVAAAGNGRCRVMALHDNSEARCECPFPGNS
jgi:hypothetical protein